MAMIDRIKGMLLAPKEEGPKVAAEPASVASLYTGWIVILAAIGPVAMLLRSLASGLGMGVGVAVLQYAISLAVAYVVALIADALAPSFDGQKSFVDALKLVAYSMTAAWVGAVAILVPFVGWIVSLAASLYSVYLFYLGAPVLKKCSGTKAVGYTVVVVLCVIVLQVVLSSLLMAMVFGGAMMGGMMMH